MQVLKTDHDRSKDHLDAVLMLAHRAKEAVLLFVYFAQQAEQVQKYVLTQCAKTADYSITTVSCERGFAFPGEDRQ